jgi:excisionase family DNA binding protein
MTIFKNVPKNSQIAAAGATRVGFLSERVTLTLQTAAEITGVSIPTLRRHEKAGRLRLLKVGGRTLVEARSLEAMLFGQAG